GDSLPLRAEVQELDDRKSDLSRERVDEERLRGPDWPADQIALRDAVDVSAGDRARGGSQPALDPLVAGDMVEREAGLAGLEQAEALGLDDPPLLGRKVGRRYGAIMRIGGVCELLKLEADQARRRRGKAFAGELAPLGEPFGRTQARQELGPI